MADKSTLRVEFNEEAKLEAPRIVLEHINDKEHWLSVNLAAYREQGRAEVLALVRKLPSPVERIAKEDGDMFWFANRCHWCGHEWAGDFLKHPSNGCLFALAQETGKEQA